MRMIREHRSQHAVNCNAAFVQGLERDLALESNQRQRRPDGNNIPARITPRKLVTGGKIKAPILIQLAQVTAAAIREGQ